MTASYVFKLLLCSAVVLLFAATLNYVVDPYGLYQLVNLERFNKKKLVAAPNGKLIKPYGVQLVQPMTLLLGNSRVEAGIDPESNLWPVSWLPVYNMSLPATGIDVATRSLQHALAVASPQTVIVGLDFFDFLIESREPPGSKQRQAMEGDNDFDNRLLVASDGSPNPAYRLQRAKDFLSTLFSLNALVDSIQTVVLQERDNQAELTDHGFNPLSEYRRFIRNEGQHALFVQVETTYLSNYLRRPVALYRPGSRTSSEFSSLRRLIDTCVNHHVRLILYIQPIHAHMLEAYWVAGLWPLFEEWKRAVVAIIDEEENAHPDTAAIDLWDFSGYNHFTTETVPAADERGRQMQWYWEAGHYRRELGEVVLSRMLNNSKLENSVADFGVKLNERNIEGHLSEIRDARQQYAKTHEEDIRQLEHLAKTISGKLGLRHP